MAVRRWLAVSAVAASVIALAGCAMGGGGGSAPDVPHDAASGGQTLAEMRDSLGAVPGLLVTDVVGGERPNVKGNTGYALSLEVEPGYAVADGAALVDFVVASVWSVREGYMPNARIDIRVRTPEAAPFDVAAAAADAGWTSAGTTAPSTYSSVAIDLSADKEQGGRNLERLGSWPGDAPDAAAGITVKE